MRVNRLRLIRLQAIFEEKRYAKYLRSLTDEELMASLAELEEQAGIPPEMRTRFEARDRSEADHPSEIEGVDAL